MIRIPQRAARASALLAVSVVCAMLLQRAVEGSTQPVKNSDGSTTTTAKDDTVVAGGTKETTRDEQGHVTKEEFKDPNGKSVRVIYTSYPPGGQRRVDQIDFNPDGTPKSTSMTLTDADGNTYSEHYVFKDSMVSGGEAEVKDTKGKTKYYKFDKTAGGWKEFHPEQWGGEWFGSWMDYALRDVEPFDSKGETGPKTGTIPKTAPKTGTDPKDVPNPWGIGTQKDVDSNALELWKAYKGFSGETSNEMPDSGIGLDSEVISNPFTPDDLCCEDGIQKFGLTVEGAATVASSTRAAMPRLPLVSEWIATLGRLVRGAPLSAARTPLSVVVTPPEVWIAPVGQSARSRGVLVTTVITSLGTSQGEAFQLQVINDGPTPIRLSNNAIVVEPLKRAARSQAQKALQQLAPGLKGATALTAEGYCLNYALQPPDAGMLFRIAAPKVQAQFLPARGVLRAAAALARAGRLTPDTNAKTYLESIKQYAVWTRLERWNQAQFADAWVAMTRKQMAALKRPWANEMESALRRVVPGRWRDIQLILAEASAAAISPGAARPR